MRDIGHTHCHRCGKRYGSNQDHWPRCCEHCGSMTWLNPFPVAVLAVPVQNEDRRGVLLIRRALEPLGWAMPGGYMDYGEDWRQSATRELREETGLKVPWREVELMHAASAPDWGTLLVFGRARTPLSLEEVRLNFRPADGEVSGYSVAYSPQEEKVRQMVYASHREVARRILTEG